MYFKAKVSKCLLCSNEISMKTFFYVDRMLTELIFLHVQKISLYILKRPTNLSEIDFYKIKIYQIFGSNMAQPQSGICEAAIVEDDLDGKGVAGFVSERNLDFALTPCLDKLID